MISLSFQRTFVPTDSLLSATHVAKGGNPNATLRSDFVKVVYFDPMEVQRDNENIDNFTSALSSHLAQLTFNRFEVRLER